MNAMSNLKESQPLVRKTIFFVSIAFAGCLFAQTPLAFDVISIKATPPGASGGGFQNSPGQFTTKNYAIRSLIVLAYGVAGYQVGELPAWTSTARYDILAKLPDGPFTPRALMIQQMLTDRFHLKTHREMSEIPSYALVYARKDGKFGPELHPTALDCNEVRAKRAGRGPATAEEMMQCNFLPMILRTGATRLRAQGVTIAGLAAALGRYVDRPIFDRTELSGGFDLDVTFFPQVGGPSSETQADAPFIFNALQEQLGLKLEPSRTQVNVLVIDSIERPTEN